MRCHCSLGETMTARRGIGLTSIVGPALLALGACGLRGCRVAQRRQRWRRGALERWRGRRCLADSWNHGPRRIRVGPRRYRSARGRHDGRGGYGRRWCRRGHIGRPRGWIAHRRGRRIERIGRCGWRVRQGREARAGRPRAPLAAVARWWIEPIPSCTNCSSPRKRRIRRATRSSAKSTRTSTRGSLRRESSSCFFTAPTATPTAATDRSQRWWPVGASTGSPPAISANLRGRQLRQRHRRLPDGGFRGRRSHQGHQHRQIRQHRRTDCPGLKRLQTLNPAGRLAVFPRRRCPALVGHRHHRPFARGELVGCDRRAPESLSSGDAGWSLRSRPSLAFVDADDRPAIASSGSVTPATLQHSGHLAALAVSGAARHGDRVDGAQPPYGGSHRLTAAPASVTRTSRWRAATSAAFIDAWRYLYGGDN